jgi:GNAT superfamily N-acetyltransferase
VAEIDVVMTVLNAAAARHGRRPWLQSHAMWGIVNDETLMGFEQGKLVATATLQGSDSDVWGPDALVAPVALYLHRLASLEPGRGFGGVMLGAAEDWAKGAGAEVMRLDCGAGNGRLRRYYLELGYAEVKEVQFRSWHMVLFEKHLRESPSYGVKG